ncbi:hypothetical protein JW926_09775 [Candidatus Sumerlaeota bacterium]|nr:hypothetical protein [Candidatus Sumerlaeota bacterium]
MKRCAQCILPANYPRISFDKDGVCNFCREYRKVNFQGDEKLIEFIRSFTTRDSQYDCLIGYSGGRDSSYLLYYISKVLKLRVIAYHFDHGLIPEQTRQNVRRGAEILGVPLIIEESDLLKKCVSHHIEAWITRPHPGLIGMLCTGCRLGTDRGLFKTARKFKTNYIAYGGHRLEGGAFKLALMKGNLENRLGNLNIFLTYGKEILKNPKWISHPSSALIQFQEFLFHFSPLRRILEKMQYSSVKSSSPFGTHIPWEERKVVETIQKELDWKNPDYGESTWRSDCKISLLKSYMYKEILGFNDKEDGLSCLIRDGQITREEALIRAERENLVSFSMIEEFLGELKVDNSRFQAALKRAKEEYNRKEAD